MNPQQKSIANVLLDMVAAVDLTGETSLPDNWTAPLAVQLAELDAVPVVDDGERLHVDITPIAGSAALLVSVIIDALAQAHDADRLAVIHTIREHIDKQL